jgi:hypothetical protein
MIPRVTTYRTLIDRLLALGILSAARADVAREAANDWGDLDEDVPFAEVGALLDDMRVAAHLTYEPHHDVEDLESSYERLLWSLASLDGGPVDVTDVELDPDAAGPRRPTPPGHDGR